MIRNSGTISLENKLDPSFQMMAYFALTWKTTWQILLQLIFANMTMSMLAHKWLSAIQMKELIFSNLRI